MSTLRPYQEQAIDAARNAYIQGARSVLLRGATGCGKSTIAAHVMRGVVARGGRALFAVHLEEVVRDVAQRLAVPCAVYVNGRIEGDPTAPIAVVSVQTLWAGDHRPPADLIVWDECHRCAARTYRDIRAAYPDAHHLGMTATPVRADRTPLGDVFEVMVEVASTAELQALGWLVQCEVVAPLSATDALADSPLTALRIWAPKRSAIIYGTSVAHAQQLAEDAAAEGYRAANVDGTTNKRERRDIIRAFGAGELDLLTNRRVLVEGVDLPRAEVCVMACRFGFVAPYLQAVGRVLRPSPETGKRDAMLIDLRGNVHLHGLPADERVYSLTGKGITRAAVEKLPIQQCRECGSVHRPAPCCPRCGYASPPAPLPTVRRVEMVRAPVVATAEERSQFLRRMQAIAAAKGYAPGWAAYRYKARFGMFPDRAGRAA